MAFTFLAAVLAATTGPTLGHLQIEAKLSLGRPVQIGRLALVPIESTIPLARDKYLTLGEASKLGVIEIVERPGGEEVNSLEVRNKANLPILLFAGELMLGGKQDRIVAKDSIVPAGERRFVPVFCVEHGRWEGKANFEPANVLVPDQVRAAAVHSRNQSMVWNEVASSNARVHAAPATGTLRGTLYDPTLQSEATKLARLEKVRFAPDSRTIGVICWLDGKIESADIFANPGLFASNRDELFHSYAVDTQLSSPRTAVAVDMKTCQAFLAQIVAARRTADPSDRTPGRFRVMNGQVLGEEFGAGRFGGGFGGGGAAGEPGGFGHGNYRPNDGRTPGSQNGSPPGPSRGGGFIRNR